MENISAYLFLGRVVAAMRELLVEVLERVVGLYVCTSLRNKILLLIVFGILLGVVLASIVTMR